MQRITAPTEPLIEKVIDRIMAQQNCSRSQAGNLILKYGTKAIIEHLKEKQETLALTQFLEENL